MMMTFCPVCDKPRGYARRIGIGTLLAAFFTGGLWLLLIPFYPKRCIECGNNYPRLAALRELV